MKRISLRIQVCVLGLGLSGGALLSAQSPAGTQKPTGSQQTPSVPRQAAQKELQSTSNPAAVANGNTLFQQNCAFCHGRDAGGGETGPDLTRSKLVADDSNGNQIGIVVKNGRIEKGMPKFDLADAQIAELAAYIHDQKRKAESQSGGRKGVDVADLQTGNAVAGKAYFNGVGNCASCHSATGDLAGIATRYQGLKLEQRMLYPEDAKAHVTVKLANGQSMTGELAYRDEFTIGLKEDGGEYHSWHVNEVQYKIDAPAEAHVEQLARYSDTDIHNLMAYLQTLK